MHPRRTRIPWLSFVSVLTNEAPGKDRGRTTRPSGLVWDVPQPVVQHPSSATATATATATAATAAGAGAGVRIHASVSTDICEPPETHPMLLPVFIERWGRRRRNDRFRPDRSVIADSSPEFPLQTPVGDLGFRL